MQFAGVTKSVNRSVSRVISILTTPGKSPDPAAAEVDSPPGSVPAAPAAVTSSSPEEEEGSVQVVVEADVHREADPAEDTAGKQTPSG